MSEAKCRQRAALAIAGMLCLAPAAQPVVGADGPQWFRGQLHTHTYWSDGRGFPEQAVKAYKERGYDFLSITDHNRFAKSPDEWRTVAPQEGRWPPKVSQPIFDAYVEAFGKDWTDTRTDGTTTSVRLKTYAELKARFEEPGKFLMLPGAEITQTVDGLGLHANYINLPTILPCIKDVPLVKEIGPPETVSERLALNASEAAQAAAERQCPHLFFLNHPFWVYCDVVPQNLIDCPEVLFFEVCNSGSEYAPHSQALSYDIEKFWDTVNAFRRIQGQPLLYGLGSDDAHFYDAERIDLRGGVGDAWVMVRAKSLTPETLIAAMRKGDFYASNGVLLEDVTFTPSDNTLRVKVKAEEGITYKIHFITTKKGFDQTVTEIESPAEKGRPARSIPLYSDDIGRIVKTVTGIEAAYRLEQDDLYVRARVESDVAGKITLHFHPKLKTAWTQPYAAERE